MSYSISSSNEETLNSLLYLSILKTSCFNYNFSSIWVLILSEFKRINKTNILLLAIIEKPLLLERDREKERE